MNSSPPYSTAITNTARDDAPWLVMVHGATHDRRYFSAQVPALQRDFRLLLIDLPGHGHSAALPGPFGFEEHAEGVLAALDAAELETLHYLATHTGSAVGLILATRYPQRFASLTLEGPPLPGGEHPSIDRIVERMKATARSQGVDAARAEWYQRGRWFDVIRNEPARCRADEHWAMLADFSGKPWLDESPTRPVAPVVERLSSIRCPVLIMNGEHDVDDFLDAAEELERRLPNVRRVRVEGAGGFPMWEDPERANAHIREHLGAHS